MKEFAMNGTPVKMWAKMCDATAWQQISNLCSLPFVFHHLALMPDLHGGKGMPIGTVLATRNVVIPNAVGVDIGCGMCAVKTNIQVETIEQDVLRKKIMRGIRHQIPLGMEHHKVAQDEKYMPENHDIDGMTVVKRQYISATKQVGTLGGGNHFIEVDYSEKTHKYYLVIHSGSRKLGGDVCKYYQDLAFQKVNEMKKIKEELIKKLKSEGREKEIDSQLKLITKPSANKDLAFLSGSDFDDYLNDMALVQKFAVLNRKTMADIIIKEMGFNESERFETIHNYIDFKRMILRKGAVSAEYGEKLLIPINMRDGSLICVGKGNEDWNFSAPHGAGRLMSRSKAKELIDLKEYKLSMNGIYSTSVCQSTLDEAPQAYKPMEEIIEAIKPTVDIIDIIKPEYNFKSK